ncbi:J domain-containing protein [Chitinophaga caseinilytica]|uniref:DnaJ domain-containing protein n=1 Tax=Chitinophaga caseinilytica TaxID=2267521 RepID=A0ABZ2Z7S4_9BACT
MQTLYQVLGVSEDATPSDIKQAFRKLSMEFHPDRNPGNPAAEARFREILDAYRVLSDPDERARYDIQRNFIADKEEYGFPNEPEQDTYERYRKEKSRKTETRIIVVIGLILIVKLLAKACSSDDAPDLKTDTYRFTQPQQPAELDSLADEKVVLRNGDTLNYLDRENNKFAGKADMKRGWMILARDDAPLLYVSAHKQDANRSEGWLFRKDPQKGMEEVLHHNGDIALKTFQLQLNFGIDVDTFRSCRVCNVADLPHPDIAGIYLVYGQKAFRLVKATKDDGLSHLIRQNLAHLASHDAEMPTTHSDNGLRKEYLRQLLTWHFLHADFQSTLQLFNTHYRYPDSKEMWSTITGYIHQYETMMADNMTLIKDEGL